MSSKEEEEYVETVRYRKGEERIIAVETYQFYVTPYYIDNEAPKLEEQVSRMVKERAIRRLENVNN